MKKVATIPTASPIAKYSTMPSSAMLLVCHKADLDKNCFSRLLSKRDIERSKRHVTTLKAPHYVVGGYRQALKMSTTWNNYYVAIVYVEKFTLSWLVQEIGG